MNEHRTGRFPLISGQTVILLVCCWCSLAVNGRGHDNSARKLKNQAKASTYHEFDVVIAGGSTAAFAAAIASARSGARTALLEPTDWVGGQLTSSGVPAVDEAWHSVESNIAGEPELKVGLIARNPANITPCFLNALEGMNELGDCWVSRFCFRPKLLLKQQLLRLQKSAGENLTVYLETVVKRVQVDSATGKVISLSAIRRFPRDHVKAAGYDVLPSEDLADWYSPEPSCRFNKQQLHFVGKKHGQTVFIDATEWGEVLALSGANYLQGVEDEDGKLTGNDTCGQSTVYCFVQELHHEDVAAPVGTIAGKHLGFGDYGNREDAWERIWTYRRIRGEGKPAPGDLCLQNWGYSRRLQEGGNDYPFGYLFKSKKLTAKEADDWSGGVDLQTMEAAEQRALAWHEWFRKHAPAPIRPTQITLAGKELGTSHGLAKLPYIRDTRRSIGLNGFLLTFADLSGPVSQRTGTRFPDRIALGAYPADVHPITTCEQPEYVTTVHDTLPFYIPFRALTHHRFGNLLVAGKTMAQSYLANSATRLHPIEWSTGTAAGVAAAYMARTHKTSSQAYQAIGEVQQLIREHTPIDWTMEPYPAKK